jgi:hypothetical protein
MFGLTSLGIVHTLISLVAVATGLYSLVVDHEISPRTRVGKTYIWTTVLTCLTGFGIFQHGGFNKAHVLGIITLVVLVIAWIAGRHAFGRASRYIAVVAYSMTYFFHAVPGLTETTTRLPLGSPIFASPDDPTLQKLITGAFVLFLIGAFLQVRKLRASGPSVIGMTA